MFRRHSSRETTHTTTENNTVNRTDTDVVTPKSVLCCLCAKVISLPGAGVDDVEVTASGAHDDIQLPVAIQVAHGRRRVYVRPPCNIGWIRLGEPRGDDLVTRSEGRV